MAKDATSTRNRRSQGKSRSAFRTISEVADDMGVPQHVLRFWESKFSQVKPLKRSGNRRYYRPEDIDLLKTIQGLLYTDGYTIKGAQKLFREHGARAVVQAYLPDGSLSDLQAPAATDQIDTAAVSRTGPTGIDHRGAELDAILAQLRDIRQRLLDS